MSTSSAAAAPSQRVAPLAGLALTAIIAAIAFALHNLPYLGAFSPLILAIVLGIAVNNAVGTPAAAGPGVRFVLRRILRAGIVLLGLQLTFAQIGAVGLAGAAVVVVTLVATFLFTKWLGARLGVDRKLAELIAAGTSVCGASAIVATNTVTRGSDEDVAYAVACVTVFGSFAMLLAPLAGGLIGLGPQDFGLWAGATIHEVAQVVAAAFQGGDVAGQTGTIAKLTRVMMLAPLVLALGAFARRSSDRGGEAGGVPVPWFVFGFIAMVAVASTGVVPEALAPWHTTLTQFMLAMALAAMGLTTDIRKLAAAGLRPALLGAAAWLFIALLGLALVLTMPGLAGS